VQGSKIFVV